MPEINYAPAPDAAPLDAYRRRIMQAQLMQRQAADASQPIYDKKGGYAKIGQGLAGGLLEIAADNREAADRQGGADLAAQWDALNKTPAPPAPVAAPPQAGPVAAPVPPSNTVGKIYNNDEPSPLDPPQGADRVKMMATVLGESANQPAVGQNAVASVIRNRAVDGGYGGDTPGGVVTAKNQFEPWNTDSGRAKMAQMLLNPSLAAKADDAIKMAYGEGGQAPNDPTNGKTMFYSPGTQAALGRNAPSWAQGPGQAIGDHTFYNGQGAGPPRTQVASADPSFTPSPASPQAIPGAVPGTQPQQPSMSAEANPMQQAPAPDRSTMMAQSLAGQPNPAATDRQALMAKIMANPYAMQMLQARKALEPTPIKLGANESLIDPNTFKPLVKAAGGGTPMTDAQRQSFGLPAGVPAYMDKDGNPQVLHPQSGFELTKDQNGNPIAVDKGDPSKVRTVGTGAPSNDQVDSLRKEVHSLPSYKNYTAAIPGYQSMTDAITRDSKASDLNLIYGLAKIFDPNSVVREGELAMAKDTQGVYERLKGMFTSVTGGARLQPSDRAALMEEAQSRMNSFKQPLDADMDRYNQIAMQRGMHPNQVLPNLPVIPEWKKAEINTQPRDSDPTKPKAVAPVKVASPDEARKLPKGTPIILPDGSQGVVP